MVKKVFIFLFLFFVSLVPFIVLVLTPGRPTTFDGPIHIDTIAQFSTALKSGDLPVVWLNNFANYGLPTGIFSQQLPVYTGALINLAINNPVFSFEVVFFLGIFLSNAFFYLFLRLYVKVIPALIGIVLLTFSPLRIIDIYIRGDLPEVFASIFLPLILLSLYQLISKKKMKWVFILALACAALTLSHPMMFFVYASIFIPYTIFLLLAKENFSFKKLFSRQSLAIFLAVVGAILLGLGLAAYYLLPLFQELKYFYIYFNLDLIPRSEFLGLTNLFSNSWYYFYSSDIAPRGHVIMVGIIEITSIFIGLMYVVLSWKNNRKQRNFVILLLLISAILLFMTTPLSIPLYSHVSFLDKLQFPWRFLAPFLFIPPLLYAVILDDINNPILYVVALLLVSILRFPQLYGKNYTLYLDSSYYATKENPASVTFNTIWTGKTEDYPVEKNKFGIINGNGKLLAEKVHNSSRNYVVDAQTPLRLVDYTFYFPGWHVYVDGINTSIEFQDTNYRGVITYNVPKGKHTVQVVLQDTMVRRIGKMLSLLSIAIFALIFLFRKKLLKNII